MFEDRGDVGGDQPFPLPHPHDKRGAAAGGHQRVRAIGGEEAEGEAPAQAPERFPHRPGQAPAGEERFDEVGDDLRVGLGDEPVSLPLQSGLQFQVVFDDAVVNDRDPARAVPVRVGVFLGRPAVGGPAGVSDAVFPVERVRLEGAHQVGQLPGGAAHRDLPASDHRQPGRVVPPVLQFTQPPEEDADNGFRPDISDDSAHRMNLALRHAGTAPDQKQLPEAGGRYATIPAGRPTVRRL